MKFSYFCVKNLNIMRKTAVLSALLPILALDVYGRDVPLVYDNETPADIPGPVFVPDAGQLVEQRTLPDPFAWADGSGRSADFADWERHRIETIRALERYVIGAKPEVHRDSVDAVMDGDTLRVAVRHCGRVLELSAVITYPEGDGPFPAMIGVGFPYGSLPPHIFTERGVAGIAFDFRQVMAHTQKRGEEPVNALYPGLESMGAYAAWPWGVSRIIDGLQKIGAASRIDIGHIGVTGCSFAGKMALFAGALDERIALTIAQEPGGGGVASWRVSETLGNVETVERTNYAWFLESMRRFSGDSVALMPVDHHQVAALVAPRALLVLGNTDYEWLADESTYVSCRAAREVWREFGVADRMGYSIEGGHGHCMLPDSQLPEVEAFVDRFLLGKKEVATDVARAVMFAATDWQKWAPWARQKK